MSFMARLEPEWVLRMTASLRIIAGTQAARFTSGALLEIGR